ncbi:MAG: hypothetical protein GC159_14405 [Phycisphaera sp.]|nr:hypothetical protein [Phycisphaera sp.]
MSSFNGQDLFGSGPHRFVVHGVSMRHATHESPGTDGVRLTAMGHTARRVDQYGTLTADDVATMQQRLDAIEAAIDGEPAELVDDLARVWSNIVMLEFHPKAIRRVGVRLAADYVIHYVQVSS